VRVRGVASILGAAPALCLLACASKTSLLVDLAAAPGINAVPPLRVRASGPGGLSGTLSRDTSFTLPGHIYFSLPDAETDLMVTASASTPAGEPLAAFGAVHGAPHRQARLTLLLLRGVPPADACDDGVQDGTETGVDCGGSCPLACPGSPCTNAASCVTNSCSGVCSLASGPPGWLPAPSLLFNRIHHQCTLGPDRKIYVVGGDSTEAGALATVETLGPGAVAWSAGPSLMTARRSFGLATGKDGVLYAAGGVDANSMIDASVEGLVAGAWTSKASLPSGRANVGATVLPDGLVVLSDVDVYPVFSPSSNSWSSIATPGFNADQTGLAVGADGRLYALGGDSTATAINLVSAYDPKSGAWTPQAPMQSRRLGAGAVAAPDGRIYAVGGDNGDAFVASVEAFTPAFNRWTAVAGMTSPRGVLGACLGADGRIYATGGLAPANVYLSSVEAYGPTASLLPTSGPAGAIVNLSARNFAAGARLRASMGGATVALAITDADGATELSFSVPRLTSGDHPVTLFDVRSQYPIDVAFAVQ
jgi:hypothetical protein